MRTKTMPAFVMKENIIFSIPKGTTEPSIDFSYDPDANTTTVLIDKEPTVILAGIDFNSVDVRLLIAERSASGVV